MSEGILTENGKLQDKFLPAIYFDSCVAIDYWMTGSNVGLVIMATGDLETIEQRGLDADNLVQRNKYLKQLLSSKATTKLNKVANIRKKLDSSEAKATAVVSPICLFELEEWYAFATFKQMASEVVGVTVLERQGRKDFGEHLKAVYESWIKRLKEKLELELWTGIKFEHFSKEETLFYETFRHLHYLEAGLKGLVLVDIRNYRLDIQSLSSLQPLFYAYVQLGAADIFHILLAQHLGCKYIASWDKDFKRVKQVINEAAGMELLSTPEEILKVI